MFALVLPQVSAVDRLLQINENVYVCMCVIVAL